MLISKRSSDSFIRWVANSAFNGVGNRYDGFEADLASRISKNPELNFYIKDAISEVANATLNAMLDKHDRPPIDELYFRIAKVNGKLVHVEVDCEVCCRLGFTSYQFLGKELSTDIVPAEHLEYRKEAYERAWNGEIVDYIGVGLTGKGYTAKLRPVYDHANQVAFVEAVLRFIDSMEIDQDVKDEMGEFQPSKYAFT